MKQFSIIFILIVFGAGSIYAQSTTLQGKVVDDSSGDPLIGASVLVKGTTRGAITDLDGNFSLSAGYGDVLVVSYLGYSSKEVTLENQTFITVRLNAGKMALDEVIIPTGETFTDPRDGEVYKIKTFSKDIGFGVMVTQTWMVENLRFEVKGGSYVYMEKKKRIDVQKYGRLYTWEAAKQACPNGWHLPSDIEWQRFLHIFVEGGLTQDDGDKKAYEVLIDGGSSGFSILLSGFYHSFIFDGLDGIGFYWSSTNYKDFGWAINYNIQKKENRLVKSAYDGSYASSCRCIKD